MCIYSVVTQQTLAPLVKMYITASYTAQSQLLHALHKILYKIEKYEKVLYIVSAVKILHVSSVTAIIHGMYLHHKLREWNF